MAIGSEEAFVAAVQARIDALVGRMGQGTPFAGVLGEVGGYFLSAPAARRARPRLVYQFGQMLGIAPERLVDLAVGTEFVHSASLLHDDVIDQAQTRRGQTAAHHHWTTTVAVLGGDALLCEALELFGGYGPEFVARGVQVVAEMTRGVVAEVYARGRTDMSPHDWRSIALAKTGVLFGWCGWACAQLVAQPLLAERLDRCGRHLGVGFQLVDDFEDLTGVQPGKPRFADLRTRFPAYPIAVAMSESAQLRAAIAELWQKPDPDEARIRAIGERILESSATAKTLQSIENEVFAALEMLGEFCDKPGGDRVATWARALRREAAQIQTRPAS